MTRDRIYGFDVPFMDWVRKHPDLPSSSKEIGFVATDVDTFTHVYKMPVDSTGTREVQALMYLEVKTRNGEPTPSQRDTLAKVNMFKNEQRAKTFGRDKQIVYHYGVSIVRLSGTTPDNSANIRWGRFRGEHGDQILYRVISVEQLVKLLRFELHPDNLQANPFRRHHKKNVIYRMEYQPLFGRKWPVKIIERS